MDPKARINTEVNRKMVLNLIATAVQSETKIEGAFEKLISAEVLDELLQGEGEKSLEIGFRKNNSLNENLNFINNIVARNDLSQESRIKQIVSISIRVFVLSFINLDHILYVGISGSELDQIRHGVEKFHQKSQLRFQERLAGS